MTNCTLELELPPHLDERVRWRKMWNSQSGEFVLYWMQTAQRVDENPALDVAILAARQLDLPLLVYQGLSERYRYASDRHHTFILQSVADLQEQFADLGIGYAFHLENREDSEPRLRELASKARLLVVEEMPVRPATTFVRAILRDLQAPVLSVDTACVFPMQKTSRAYERAFEFRQATRQGYQQRIDQVWPETSAEVKTLSVNDLPFTPIEIQRDKIPELISRCRIDHSVSPVADTHGGSVAGYERWELFLKNRIRKYAKGRNDPLRQAVSRMSAYLHYGMVSPMRLARDASAVNAEKYLDELLIWRELAYHFCFHRHDVDRLSALPHWAQKTLQEHVRDPRPEIHSWEELARGRTGDDVWDAAQASLLKHGELHNNIRMTWGKALLNWTASPQKALSMLIDLNHRFALDGRDPASYGGILWCLGQFDRPFQPERQIHGLVRGRTTAEHRKRMDVEAYRLERTQPNWRHSYRVAVIGAGISGMAAARTLADQGVEVEVFEKSRGLGGRMSTRRVDGKPGFDHGAQYFTARNPIFKRYVNSWIEQGLVQKWSGAIGSFGDGLWTPSVGSTERFVGVPSMNSICKHLGQETQVHKQTRIDRVEDTDQGLSVVDDQGESYGPYDWVVVSAPAFQASEILRGYPEVATPLAAVKMDPCWAAMVTLGEPLEPYWAGAFLQDSFLSWAARNGTKPGRPAEVERLIIHAAPEWTEEHWESDPTWVSEQMLKEFARVTGIQSMNIAAVNAHRWKFALTHEPLTCGAVADPVAPVVACGDWAMGSRVEGGFLSGFAAAGHVMRDFASRDLPATTEQLQLF